MIITVLVIAIAILSLMQYDDRAIPAQIFAAFYLMYAILFSELQGYEYFLTAVLIDVIIIGILTMINYDTKLTIRLITMSLCIMILNSLSWVAWEYRINYEPTYEIISVFLYLSIIAILIEGNNGTNNLILYSCDYIRRAYNKGFALDSQVSAKKKAS